MAFSAQWVMIVAAASANVFGAAWGRPAVFDVAAPVDESVCTLTAPAPHHDPTAICCDACMHPYLLTTTRTKQIVVTAAGFQYWFAQYSNWVASADDPTAEERFELESITREPKLNEQAAGEPKPPWGGGPPPAWPTNGTVGEPEIHRPGIYVDRQALFEWAAGANDDTTTSSQSGSNELEPDTAENHIAAAAAGESSENSTTTSSPDPLDPLDPLDPPPNWHNTAARIRRDLLIQKQIFAEIETYIKESTVETNEICGRCITRDECADMHGRVEIWHHRCIAPY